MLSSERLRPNALTILPLFTVKSFITPQPTTSFLHLPPSHHRHHRPQMKPLHAFIRCNGTHINALPAAFICVFFVLMTLMVGTAHSATPTYRFTDNFFAGWRPDHVWLADQGRTINLKLDNTTGSGFRSFYSYLHGYVSMKIKLVPRNSAGVVVAYYMTSYRTSTTDNWDEVDFEFLGNVTGQPWILQTNIFTNGTGGREQRVFLWFDPTTQYHTYSVLWNSHQIVWYVDAVPIRVYRKTIVTEATYPSWKPMFIYSSIWDGDSWATRGGLEKINWTYAPFIATYSKFLIDACKWVQPSPPPSCFTNTTSFWWDQPNTWTLSSIERKYYSFITKRYTVYDYCTDYHRYPIQRPECQVPPWD